MLLVFHLLISLNNSLQHQQHNMKTVLNRVVGRFQIIGLFFNLYTNNGVKLGYGVYLCVVCHRMRIFTKLIFIGLLSLLYKVTCAQSTVKLKGTGYFMTLPKSYKIEKKQGIDYKTFYLLDKTRTDSSKTFVMFGCCVGTIGEGLANANKIDSVKKIVLGQEVQWKIYTWNSYYLAETLVSISDHGKAAFGIKTKHRDNVNLLISSFETLRKSR
jgi:hypothetical protein